MKIRDAAGVDRTASAAWFAAGPAACVPVTLGDGGQASSVTDAVSGSSRASGTYPGLCGGHRDRGGSPRGADELGSVGGVQRGVQGGPGRVRFGRESGEQPDRGR